MKYRIKIHTENQQLYEKLNLLNIVDEVVVDNSKVVNNIIKRIGGLEGIKISDKILLIKKKSPIRLDIYLR